MLPVWISKTVIETGDTEQTKITDWERNGAANPTYKSIYVLRGESVSANLNNALLLRAIARKFRVAHPKPKHFLVGK